MFFCFCLTVVTSLLEMNHIDLKQIGRLEVGSEIILDKSKCVKNVLMQIFEVLIQTNFIQSNLLLQFVG